MISKNRVKTIILRILLRVLNSVGDRVMQVCVLNKRGFSCLGFTDLAEVWGMITGGHQKTWEESVFVRVFVSCSFPFLCGDCLPHQVNTGALISFLEKRNFELKAQCLLLTTVYSSRSSCFAVLHSINRKEFTNGWCGKQGWFWFSDVSLTRNSMCHKKHWGFRF